MLQPARRSQQALLAPKRGIFGYQVPKGIQSYLRTWGIYDSIESGLSEVKKVRYMGVALKKKKKMIFGPKMQFFVKNPGGFFQPNVPIRYIILLSNRIHRYDNIWFPFGSQHLTQLRTLMAIFYTAQEINVNFPFLE